jgi:hypothetical protein
MQMKRTLFFVVTMLLVAPHAPLAAQASASTDAMPLAVMQHTVLLKEQEGLDDLKAGNLDGFAALTADDALFVDSAGPATKAQVMKNVVNFHLTDYTIENVQFVQLSPTSGLIHYKITESGSSHGRDFTAKALISSIWTRRGDAWLCIFSQETVTH